MCMEYIADLENEASHLLVYAFQEISPSWYIGPTGEIS